MAEPSLHGRIHGVFWLAVPVSPDGWEAKEKIVVRHNRDMTPRYMSIPKYSTLAVAQQNPGGMIASSKRGHIVRRSTGEHHERPDRTRQRCHI